MNYEALQIRIEKIAQNAKPPGWRDSFFNPKQARGGSGNHPQACSSLCCAETVSSRKLKLSDLYYILAMLLLKSACIILAKIGRKLQFFCSERLLISI